MVTLLSPPTRFYLHQYLASAGDSHSWIVRLAPGGHAVEIAYPNASWWPCESVPSLPSLSLPLSLRYDSNLDGGHRNGSHWGMCIFQISFLLQRFSPLCSSYLRYLHKYSTHQSKFHCVTSWSTFTFKRLLFYGNDLKLPSSSQRSLDESV